MIKKLLIPTVALLIISHIPISPLHAATLRDVVINEVAWAGSADNSADEWIELYNNTANSIDITGWIIEDDNGSQTYPLTGSIAGHSYYLLESRESATSLPGDGIHTLSLSNSGDSLVLKDGQQTIIDSVNESSAAWPAGNNTVHASMERIDPTAEGNVISNWQTSIDASTATASTGSAIIGTPRSANTHSSMPPTTTTIQLNPDKTSVSSSDQVIFTVNISNAQNISNLGIDLSYDPTKLHYISTTEGSFLNAAGTVPTSFQSGLQNNQEGLLVIGNARTITPLTGMTGNGELFHATFSVLNNAVNGNTTIAIEEHSFISTPTSHSAISSWPSTQIIINGVESIINPISNLRASPSNDRYSISLNWQASATNNVQYAVYRKDVHQIFQLLGTTSHTTFTDHEGIVNGGNIIPHVDYDYQVIAQTDGKNSTPTLATGTETRGLKGDNDRSDRVDGNDLENIARSWTADDTQADFSALIDTNFDGVISGSDLIDLAVNWAKTYS